MAHKIINFLALFAILAYVLAQKPQGVHHENQGRSRREASDYDDNTDNFPSRANWTACDVNTTPILSCYDCTTRMICKDVGGILKICRNPWRPHCNRGLCSAVPNPSCV